MSKNTKSIKINLLQKKALTLIKNGYSVIPCGLEEKAPRIPDWEEYQSRVPTKKEVIWKRQ